MSWSCSFACMHQSTLHDVDKLICRCRDVNLIDPKDVQYLCTKLQKLYAFSEREIQQVPDLLENCQRHPKEFLLRLKSKAQQRSKQHRTVKDFAPQLRARYGS